MRNKIKLLAATVLAATASLISCSDWTEVESIGLKEPNIETQHPELYQKYLENLRTYKQGPHKWAYAWFDNSHKLPQTQAHHLTTLPDSIDVVVLMHPDNLVENELKEMQEVRDKKGTRFVYAIELESIQAAYTARQEQATEEKPLEQTFEDFCVDSLQHAFSLAKEYAYDGICMGYSGKSTLHMDETEKAEYLKTEKLFTGLFQDWSQRNADKLLVFAGKPQNLTDKSILARCRHILVSGKDATSSNELTYKLLSAATGDVPRDRLGMFVSAPALDDPNRIIGYFSNGSLAMQELAAWAPSLQAGIEVSAVGVYNVSTDYYQPSSVYKYTRELIASVNPVVN